jgi:type III restriction enzyme
MELKNYQRQVIADLSRYLDFLNRTQNSSIAYKQFWNDKGINVGFGGVPAYQDIMPGVPNICFKVPTGGGKTFLACNAIRPIFDALPVTKTHVVVWLVPSDAILTQTVKCLKDTYHPYRQKIDVDFGSRVEVYTKQELLNGQNFNPTTVTEQLSIMVLSYDSFRGRGKDVLKAYQENSNLAPFAKVLGAPEQPIENADDTALFQIINQLSPLVIVDESHHAKTQLSLDMLRNFNPCFTLELTATPRKESNIISYVDAVQLKKESMVKLPVVVYNRDSQNQVLADAIDLRRKLESLAEQEQANTGRYIRPIVLFQAQPRGKENSTTFEKLRDKLVEIGIPSEHIAIRTADVNELKNIDLMSEDCPIRYIITVNALKEGWDCPFAYILASLANKTSQVDVEQILGRILRLPHTKENKERALNLSYVLTSSNDFDTTVKKIISGLNSAGFSDKDCRLPSELVTREPEMQPVQETLMVRESPTPYETGEEFLDFDSDAISRELETRKQQPESTGKMGADSMISAAEETVNAYEQAMHEQDDNPFFENMSWEVRDKVNTFSVKSEFREEIAELMLPQFFYVVPDSLFTEGCYELLEKEHLSHGFTLKGKPYDIDFASADTEMVWVDVKQTEGSTPKVFKMSATDQIYFKEYFSNLPPEAKVRQCKDIIHRQLNKMNGIDSVELSAYIDRIVADMTTEQLSALEKSPLSFAEKIKDRIKDLLGEHYAKTFNLWMETGEIVCLPSYKLPAQICPISYTTTIGGSLYTAEEDMNGLERELVMELTALDNIRWWHRNISKQEFRINGFINHYPDIMIKTQKGNLVLAETKGDHLKNDDSRQKVELGRAWQNAANEHGKKYYYYMVFRDTDPTVNGAVNMSHFLEILKRL